ncbi:MAG: hypothetical protein ACI8QC_003583 [Planctomycetota bacterium]
MASGSPFAQDNDLVLTAYELPPNQSGFFLNSGAGGELGLALDLANTLTPSGPVAVLAGETWNFQCWYRDNNPGPTSNFSDAVSVTFR